jgi:hypothetical protein
MKVNPLAPDEKSLLSGMTKSNLASGLRGKTLRKQDKFKCGDLLKTIVEGKIATVVMSLITVFALVGVSLFINAIVG